MSTPDPPAPPAALFLIGPTGAGKTALSLRLARRFDLELVCLDSMQVYRGAPVATAQPTPEERAAAPHHLFAGVDPAGTFDTARYVEAVRALLEEPGRDAGRLLFVGGTGLYYDALLDGLSPLPPRSEAARARIRAELAAGERARLRTELEAADPEAVARIDPHDDRRLERALEILRTTGRPPAHFQALPRRPLLRSRLSLGLRPPRAWLHERLAARMQAMVEAGLVEEMRGLWERHRHRGREATSLQAIGYRHFAAHFEDEILLEEAVERTLCAHRRYVRRQETWFRRRPEIRWLDPSEPGYEERACERVADQSPPWTQSSR